MKTLTIVFSFMMVLGSLADAKVRTSTKLEKQQGKIAAQQQLLKVDNALESCLRKTQTANPESIESLRAVQLREKVFFALTEARSKNANVSELTYTLKEARVADGIGRQCKAELRRAFYKKSRTSTL